MKKTLLITILIMSVFLTAKAEEDIDLLDSYAKEYSAAVEKGIEGIEIPGFDTEEILKELNSGKLSYTPKEILEYILKILLGEVAENAKLLAIVLALSVLSSYLSGLKDGFGGEAVANCGFYACYVIIAGIAATAFYDAAVGTGEAVRSISFFMRVIVPVIITTMLTSGAVISAATLEPALLAMVEIAVWIIETVFIPAVMISAALNIVNGMSDKFKTDRMVKLLGSAVKWGLTVTLTVFVSLAGLKSIAASGVDGLTVKLSKFATANLIPMVGGILAESVETVMSCSVVIKNSVGIMGIICVLLIAFRPVIKVAAILIMFRVAAAVAEPVSESKIVECMSRLADSIAVLFSMLTAGTLMFIMVLTIMINTGNSVYM